MPNRTVSWKDLGSPTKPGVYAVPGVGEVNVTAGDIEDAQAVGGNPLVELHDSTTYGHRIRQFVVGLFTPQRDEPQTAEATEGPLKPRFIKFLVDLAST